MEKQGFLSKQVPQIFMNNIKLSFISLGCPKNSVDSEKIINNFNDPFFSFEPDPSRADAFLIKTCGFINPAID